MTRDDNRGRTLHRTGTGAFPFHIFFVLPSSRLENPIGYYFRFPQFHVKQGPFKTRREAVAAGREYGRTLFLLDGAA